MKTRIVLIVIIWKISKMQRRNVVSLPRPPRLFLPLPKKGQKTLRIAVVYANVKLSCRTYREV